MMEDIARAAEAQDARTLAIVAAILLGPQHWLDMGTHADEALNAAAGLLEGAYQRSRTPPEAVPAEAVPPEDDDLPF